LSIELTEFNRSADLAEQRELFDDAFAENKGQPSGSTEHYEWKFSQAPATPPSYEFVARENGRMLGYYAAIPYPYRVGDRSALAGMTCDVMTHSQARGKGIFTKLGKFAVGEMARSELSFLTGYPIRPEVMGGHLRVGWEIMFELPMYLRPLRANSILATRRLGWLAPPVNVGIAAYQTSLRPRARSGHEMLVGDPRTLFRSPQFDAFVARWSEGVRNHLVKTADFYAWRLGAPGTDYRAFLVTRGEQILAAAVGRLATLHGIPSFALLDLMSSGEDAGALATLYSEIDREARMHEVEAVVAMMSRSRARQYRLARYGFLRSPFAFKLIIHRLDGAIAPAELTDERSWHLMWIDSDDL
jgi:hypothetical protein